MRSRFRSALEKGLPYSLTPEWAESRWTGRCEVTDIPFNLLATKSDFYSPSIDRISPELGYTPENSRFVLFALNSFKNVGTDADVLRVARIIVEKSSTKSTD